ncbi:MAG: CHAT domain-containing protein [Pseudonocardiaceae bacterium]
MSQQLGSHSVPTRLAPSRLATTGAGQDSDRMPTRPIQKTTRHQAMRVETSHADVHKAGAARVLARDDLLQVAHDAEAAIGIALQRDRLGHAAFTEPELFDLAFQRLLQGAKESDSWAVRGQDLAYAGAILRFCELVDISIPAEHDSVRLYRWALEELSAARRRPRSGALNHEDLTLGVITTYRAIRNLRLAGKSQDALLLARQPDEYFHGSGAEPHRGHFEFEVSACQLGIPGGSHARAELSESEGYWASARPTVWPTRNRYEFGRALAAFAEGDTDATERHLEAALTHLQKTRGTETHHDVQELSLTLAFAEYLVMGGMNEATTQRALALIAHAVSLTEQIRGRWRVVARSRSPLSLAFQRIYGDIALLVSRLPGPEAARLGLRVSISAKQTGFASLMRANRSLMNTRLRDLVDDIVAREDQLEYTNVTIDDELGRLHRDLKNLRAELADAVSPLLADFVLPEPASLEPVIALLGTRYVVDFVALPETATQNTNWFYTLIQPDHSIEFGRLRPGKAFQKYFYGRDGRPALVGRLKAETVEHDRMWRELAQELLPASLLAKLSATPVNEPIDLLISPHSDLCLVPWPALQTDDSGTRLVQHAVITQTPALTCLSQAAVPPVRGPALVRLVAPPRGVNIEREREAWGLAIDHYEDGHGQVLLSRCDLRPGRKPAKVLGDLISVLQDEASQYGFVHVAAHGGSTGFAQQVRLPERLTVGHALGLRWPAAVLLAACHMGEVKNIREAEPFGFPIALLAGGAQCVVAGIEAVSDEGTGMIAAAMVDSLHQGTRLDVALRDAQCTFLSEGWDVYDWGLLSAFVR